MLWIGLLLIFCFAVALSYGVFESRIQRLALSRSRVSEASWDRLAKLPLFISLSVSEGGSSTEFMALIKQKELLLNESLGFVDRMAAEKKLTELISQLVVSLGQKAKNPQLLAVIREMEFFHQELNRALSQYNFHMDGIVAMKRLPWFAVWGFLAKKVELSHVQSV